MLPTKQMIETAQSVAEIANAYEKKHFTEESLSSFLFQETLNMPDVEFDVEKIAEIARDYVDEDVINSIDEEEENRKFEKELEGEYDGRQYA